MMRKIITCVIFSLFLVGCARVDPFSPRSQQRIANQGKIDDIKSTQDAIVKEVGQLKNDITGDRNRVQSTTGTGNLANTGVQILSGDSALVVIFCLGALGILGVIYYRTKAINSQKAANIFAQQIALQSNPRLDDAIFLAAMNSPAEADVYHTMVKSQALAGRKV